MTVGAAPPGRIVSFLLRFSSSSNRTEVVLYSRDVLLSPLAQYVIRVGPGRQRCKYNVFHDNVSNVFRE